MKKTIKILITSILCLIMLTFPSFGDEITIIDQFKNNINKAYNNYIIYDYISETGSNSEIELIIVEGIIDEELSLSLYYKPLNNAYSTTMKIGKNNQITTYNVDPINGGQIYNIKYQETDNLVIYILNSIDESKYLLKYDNIYSIEDIKNLGTTGEGTNKFPANTAKNTELNLKGCLAIISVTGIFIIGLLIILIAILITTKNIKIKREPQIVNYSVPRNQTNQDEQIIDVNDPIINEEPKEELTEEQELKRLYSLRARNEITEEELNTLLRKYRGKRDDD